MMTEIEIITCSICYNEFYDEDDKDKDYYDDELDINLSLECETENCECIICHKCEMKLLSDPKIDDEYIKCPMCRQTYWKHYFNTMVLQDIRFEWREKRKKNLNWTIKYLREEKERIDKELQESLEKLAIYD
tara:strand:+ start:573 stop:968 length:396 start_codon:yes stop_codon:yes gene_type:complete